jgi:oxygen-independent coproporphyrinogen-3 oxidase
MLLAMLGATLSSRSRTSSHARILYFKVPNAPVDAPFTPRHVYVHVPFCGRRCSYCDFSIAVRRVVPVDEYLAALATELRVRFPEQAHWPVDTLYFGGGTPSRLGADGVARMLDTMRQRVEIAADAEVTLEANPEDITREAVATWRSAGVNRLSIGVQSFDEETLKWMHRTHDAAAIAHSVGAARAGGIDNFSLDLIFSLPGNATPVPRSWRRDVELALELEPAHLSLYGLTIEPHTPLGRWEKRGDVSESPEEQYEAEFLAAHDALTTAGLEHYEVSNFGRPGLHARHNSSYWHQSPYAGLGPSAHEFDGEIRRWNVSAYSDWLAQLSSGHDPIGDREILSENNRVAENVYLGLRTTAGLELHGAELDYVAPWVASGWGSWVDGNRLVLTPLGWLRLDALAVDLTLVRSRF